MPLQLYYFGRAEFQRGEVNWFDDMDQRLLVLLDAFRHQWGRKVVISPHPAALGRHGSATELSDHNITIHGRVFAADVMPQGMTTQSEVNHALLYARRIGFTSIGVYPDWSPAPGLHLGTRPSRRPGDAAEWGAVRQGDQQVYVSLDVAINRFRG